MKRFFKKIIKKIPGMYKMYLWINNMFFCGLTVISPVLNTKMRYYLANNKKLDLKNPKVFSEKLLWLKLNKYMNNPLVIQCADKYKVREYVESVGCGDLLNDLIGVYDRAEYIPWESLPEKFVLKWNFGAGMNIICKNKADMNKSDVIKQLKNWGNNKYWLPFSEMQYKYIPKKIVCEKYLSVEKHKTIPDYKVYCFHGKPLAIFVMHGRGDVISAQFMDTEWNKLENTNKYKGVDFDIPKPACLEKMIESSEKLSKGFEFVRCDFYIVNDRLYFGEMTFTPAGGLCASETRINGKSMGEYINI